MEKSSFSVVDNMVNSYNIYYDKDALHGAGYASIGKYIHDVYDGNPWMSEGDGIVDRIEKSHEIDYLGADIDSVYFYDL